ncbi:MAG: hypothetical protein LBM01_03575 [Christensenellaceae bacterium]|jgi:hypothetical protein|nr:hypothetical protein [Christensenellaceae bacterium]
MSDWDERARRVLLSRSDRFLRQPETKRILFNYLMYCNPKDEQYAKVFEIVIAYYNRENLDISMLNPEQQKRLALIWIKMGDDDRVIKEYEAKLNEIAGAEDESKQRGKNFGQSLSELTKNKEKISDDEEFGYELFSFIDVRKEFLLDEKGRKVIDPETGDYMFEERKVLVWESNDFVLGIRATGEEELPDDDIKANLKRERFENKKRSEYFKKRPKLIDDKIGEIEKNLADTEQEIKNLLGEKLYAEYQKKTRENSLNSRKGYFEFQRRERIIAMREELRTGRTQPQKTAQTQTQAAEMQP